jgi:hypothetical protein
MGCSQNYIKVKFITLNAHIHKEERNIGIPPNIEKFVKTNNKK